MYNKTFKISFPPITVFETSQERPGKSYFLYERLMGSSSFAQQKERCWKEPGLFDMLLLTIAREELKIRREAGRRRRKRKEKRRRKA